MAVRVDRAWQRPPSWVSCTPAVPSLEPGLRPSLGQLLVTQGLCGRFATLVLAEFFLPIRRLGPLDQRSWPRPPRPPRPRPQTLARSQRNRSLQTQSRNAIAPIRPRRHRPQTLARSQCNCSLASGSGGDTVVATGCQAAASLRE